MLHRRLIPDDVAQTVLDRLTEVGLIDDRAYAQVWVRSRHTSQKLAGRALARELAAKGVDPELTEEALGSLSPESEEAAATALVRSKLSSLRRADTRTRERRLAAVLGRKGYSPDVIYTVVRRELDLAVAQWQVEDDERDDAEAHEVHEVREAREAREAGQAPDQAGPTDRDVAETCFTGRMARGRD